MHIIIAGCGRLGSNLAMELTDKGYDIAILDQDNEKLNVLQSGFNGMKIKGVEYDNDNLIEAGIKYADAVLAVSADDNINITVALIAKKIYNVPNIIARINDPNRKHIYEKLNIEAISPVQLSVDLLKNRLLKQSHDVIAVLDDDYEIIEYRISKKNTGSVKHFENKYTCIISAMIKDGKTYIPDRDEILKENDKVICTICNGNIVRLLSSYSEAV